MPEKPWWENPARSLPSRESNLAADSGPPACLIMHTLPAGFLGKLVARLDNENTLGIALAGSFAREEGGCYSDVDLWHYHRQEPSSGFEKARLEIVDGHLVSVKTSLIEKDYAAIRNPEKAIWAIPGIRQAQILLDKDGALETLKKAAQEIKWVSLQADANSYASHTLAGLAEEIYKILDGLAKENESKSLYAIWSLTQDLATALLVQRGVFIPTENAYIDCAQATAGRTSDWTRQFRLAIGLDLLHSDKPAFIGIGIAGLQLYRESVNLLREVLQPDNARIVELALETMKEAGY